MNIEELIGKMTVEEKISLLAGASPWRTQAIERLNIPSIKLTDGPHGVRLTTASEPGEMLSKTQPATAFPIEAAMAATWNEPLIHELGVVIAEECQYYDVGIILGPGMNGKRSPLGGRNFEYFSEDPFLTGKIGASFVKGVQEGGVGTSIKHFAANEQETNRMVVSSEVDERTLRELYMLPFEMVINEAKPWTIMCSYNKVNGIHMANNDKYLNGLLKQEWGFEGLVMSDWGAAVDKVASVQYGLDLEMPGPGHRNAEVVEAYRNKQITAEQLDDHVRRILKVIHLVLAHKREVQSIDVDHHHAIARRVAEEAIVLLKNEDFILPLVKKAKIAVLGKFAEAPRFQGGGSSHMNPALLDIPLQEISKFAHTVYGAGYDETDNDELLKKACELAAGQDAVIIFVGTTEKIESEGYDREDLNIPRNHTRLIDAVSKVNPNVIIVVNSGSAIDIGTYESQVKAIVQAWLPGQAGGSAIANVLFGEVNPSGKLTETFPLALEHNPSYLSFPGNIKQVKYAEGIFVGYRYYDTKKLDVKYAFGYGLSYTEFEYSNLRLSSNSLKDGDVLKVTVDVKNVGECTGKEVVQVYVRDVKSSVLKADKELKGFAKVELIPGETKSVQIEVNERAFSHYIEHLGKFAVESGEFQILVGASSRDIRLFGTTTFTSSGDLREPLTLQHSLQEWLKDGRYADKVQFVMSQMSQMKINEDNPLYPIVLGMPIRIILSSLQSYGYSQEVVDQIHGMFSEASAAQEIV
ncbi:glycoside hydrolase family 3 C-terminal domain-containing protein [Paenibacillus qinlingensis]|uniref:glycoside hydrolase family 3 C-terminal domain-containing protein n=1 Tax=Paenibacillus qinlingensis TaxID=1837343 RepID=UPI001565D1BB|nr:glycoside hydrolase family 3 C-terminal domain-containing protein [Paenibacillus qinlingensis]NQX60493.1 glycoside hydrolase family 3 C-terminal domain-containing protein [Paenibacillus qinlingensis]